MSFNTPIDRRNANSSKWDLMEKLFGVAPDSGLAMWTADSDYQTAPCVLAAIDRALAVRPEQRTPPVAVFKAGLGLAPAPVDPSDPLGLADSLPENVTLHENTPVTAMEQANGIRLTTPGGSLVAPQMILATNGFASQFGLYTRHLLPFAAHASLTRPLNPQERAVLGGQDDWGLTPANAFAGVTMRFTRDHRILIRQKFRYAPEMRSDDAERAAARVDHMERFRRRFPMLPDVTMDFTWTGFICLSKNNAPGFGRIAPGIHAAVCQNAVGVTKGTIGGLLAADMACGIDNPLIADMESLGAPEKLPPALLLKLGVPARMAWDIWRARHET